MATYLVNWNPTLWPWENLADFVADAKAGKMPMERWNTGNRRDVAEGDRIFLVRQKTLRGIMGSGFAVADSYTGPHWDATRTDTSRFVDVRWDAMVEPEQRLPVEQLMSEDLGVPWNSLRQSGIHVPDESVPRLEQLWQQHLRRIGWLLPQTLPEELPVGHRFAEGAAKQITINAYERNAQARQKCIDVHGTDCSVCGFSFAAFYGEIGDGYIHVHHLRDLATVGEEYEVDPVKDLLPVCPNCHAMLHTKAPAMSIEALREMIRG